MSAPEPEMTEPDDASSEEQEAPPTPPSASPPARQRPDWLVGAEEGVASEWTRTGGSTTPQQPVKLKLVRPEDVVPPEQEGGPAPGAQRLHLMGPDENVGLTRPDGNPLPASKPVPRPAPKRPTAWTAAASSVPTIKRSAPEIPQPKFNRMQDGEAEDPERGADPIVAAETGVLAVRAKSEAPVTLAPLKESWTIVALDALRHNTRLQIGIGVALLLVLAWTFWPRGETGVSISRIRHHPEQFDSQMVRVHGKIGDVYEIAGGYTFYLLQGRDTLVVFTRTRVPVRDDNVSIRGTISTGYLDGVAGQALFEDGKQ